MLPNYLIGLREGLEAALVIGILTAFIVKAKREDLLKPMWIGIAVALVGSFVLGAFLTFSTQEMSFEAQEAFGGTMSLIAVGFVTWMIFWMKSAARSLKGHLGSKVGAAMVIGPIAIVATAFTAVAREGLETALFVWANARAAHNGPQALGGVVLGLLTSSVLGYLLYRGAIRLNLSVFFKVTGVALIIMAAGVVGYAVHDLQEASLIAGLNSHAYDISSWYRADAWYGALMKGIFNFSPKATFIESMAWLCYLIPVMTLFLMPAKQKSDTAKERVPAVTTN